MLMELLTQQHSGTVQEKLIFSGQLITVIACGFLILLIDAINAEENGNALRGIYQQGFHNKALVKDT